MLRRFSNGNVLMKFIACETPVVPDDDNTPLTWAAVVIQKDGQFLLLHNPNRKQWECAGGGWEDGETIEECAIREAYEETGQRIHSLKFVGLFKLYLKNKDQDEYGALYTATFDERLPFTVNSESDRIRLWNPKDTLDDRLSELSQWMIGQVQLAN